uniref:Uncharacterized protein n=1 Tax=Romanomermis culicivorax TaxID=13658 RepID=A0A915JRK4_ROMCU
MSRPRHLLGLGLDDNPILETSQSWYSPDATEEALPINVQLKNREFTGWAGFTFLTNPDPKKTWFGGSRSDPDPKKNLSQRIRVLNVAIATIIYFEQLFSGLGQIYDPTRNCLEGDTGQRKIQVTVAE